MDAEIERDGPNGAREILAVAQALALEEQGEPANGEQREAWAKAQASARHLAVLALGPGRWPGEPTDAGLLQRRFEFLDRGAHVLDLTLRQELEDERALARLWQLVLQGPEAPAFTSVASMCLGRTLPISLADSEGLNAVTRPDLATGMSFATGLAAHHGCRTAARVVRGSLARTPHTRRVLATLRGLGDGDLHQGAHWLAQHTLHAHEHADQWCAASLGAAVHLITQEQEAALELTVATLTTNHRQDSCEAALESLILHATPERRGAFYNRLAGAANQLPGNVRAHILQHGPAPSPVAWRTDMSPAVILAGYAQELPPGTPHDQASQELLLQRFHHPDESVRRETTALLCQPKDASHLAIAPRTRGGSLVDLPPSSFAHNALDQLRLAVDAANAEAIQGLLLNLEEADYEPARRAMRAGLKRSDMALRRALIDALGRIGDAGLDGPFLVGISRRYRSLEGPVATAIRALDARTCAEPLRQVFRRRLKWADDEAFSDLLAVTDVGGIDMVRDALSTRFYPAARAGGARAAAREGYRELVFALREMSLVDTGSDAREAALQAYVALQSSARPGPGTSRGHLLLTCTNADLDAVAESLADGPDGVLPGVRATLQRGSWRRRVAACRVAGSLTLETAESLLVDTLLDLDEDVRHASLDALTSLGWEPSTPSDHTRVAMAARRTFGLLSTPELICVETLECGFELGGQIFRTEVLNVLEHLPGWQANAAMEPLVHITRMAPRDALACEGGLRALLAALDRTWQDLPHRAHLSKPLQNVPADELKEALECNENGWRARSAIASALGREGQDAVTEILTELLQDDDDDVRRAAVAALVSVGTEKAAATLTLGMQSPFREDRAGISRALAAIGTPSLSSISALATSEWWEERLGAALALHAWRGNRSVAADLLTPLALDTEHRVAQAALEALEHHGALPSKAAIAQALAHAQGADVAPLVPWLSLHRGAYLADEAALTALRSLLETAQPDDANFGFAIMKSLRALDLRSDIEALLSNQGNAHLSLRLAAAQTLRSMDHDACSLCNDRGSIQCPTCDGDGEMTCVSCNGRSFTQVACTAYGCSARDQTRAIGSLPCKACRGRGTISAPCVCIEGLIRCDLCRSVGRHACPLCREPLSEQGTS